MVERGTQHFEEQQQQFARQQRQGEQHDEHMMQSLALLAEKLNTGSSTHRSGTGFNFQAHGELLC